MTNRLCVWIDTVLYAVNPENEIMVFLTGKPSKIGDDVLIVTGGVHPEYIERKVRFLRSTEMAKDSTYLVDLEAKEAWHYTLEGELK